MQTLGKQTDGQSNDAIYAMALRALSTAPLHTGVAVDVGAGAGNFTRILAGRFEHVHALDAFRPADLPANAVFHETDLNGIWPLTDNTADLLVALEVVEHLENPRHFFREITRILRPGGCGFVSTPNNHSLSSLLTFLTKGQHRAFQAPSYPAHITPVLKIDLERMLQENGLHLLDFFYSNRDTLPLLHTEIRFGGPLFSFNFGVLFQQPAQ
ncbi:MAG: methyltransferase domain-containing protein [Saprospiraceae bacterium]|jgi:2-polyprenyl-3-methyl-5-hydroxy-6-metoxy-1,4-benzoquinol methylase|nr:methyltransferase domain-containing protein [Saprospiraceae bacterium]